MEKELSLFLDQNYGVDLTRYEESFLNKTISKRISSLDLLFNNEYLIHVKNNENEVKELTNSLHVNFSEFFRNPLTFACLEQTVLPVLIKKKNKEIRIWSSGCAAGQESYSLAILFDELISSAKSNIAYRIFATDINENVLTLAKKGVYQTPAVSKVSLKRIRTYFTQRGDTYTISTNLSECIDFSIFDMLQELPMVPSNSVFGNFDLVFCSNLLYYYRPEYQKRILEKIMTSLAPGGYLITGETEREIVKAYNFREVFVNSAIFKKLRLK